MSGGKAATIGEATAALAEIQQRQGPVIEAVLVPGWYWWVMGAGIIAIGARDSGNHLVAAIAIPVVAMVMALLTGAMIPATRRRVQIHRDTQPGPRAAAILRLIVLVDGVSIGTSETLAASDVAHPVTIG